MSKIVFIQFGDTRQLELKIDGDSTWMTVADEFVSFLQGCGYQVTGAEVADYLTEVYSEVQLDPEQSFDFATASEQFNQDSMDSGSVTLDDVVHMTLDDVMHVWGTTPITDLTNTITITTR